MKAFALLFKNKYYDWYVSEILPDKKALMERLNKYKSENWFKVCNQQTKIVPCEISFNLKTWVMLRKEVRRKI